MAQVRRLAAILHADVVGYSRLMADDEDPTVASILASRQVIRPLVEEHRGRIWDDAGDNFLAEFPTATEAGEFAVVAQEALTDLNEGLSSRRRMDFRMGIHIGEVQERAEGIFGDGVNIAARLQELAEPGGICISGTVYEQVRSRLALQYEDLGERNLKNIPLAVRAFRIPGSDRARLPPEPQVRNSIAVLPFINMSGTPENEVFSDGLAEEILNLLTRLRELKVAARTSSFSFKGKAADIRSIAGQLGVRYVLEGSVRRQNHRVRVTAQLVDGQTGFHEWSETYDRELRDIFAIQDDISREVVRALRVALSSESRARLSARSTHSIDAYEYYLQGRSYLRRPHGEDVLENATQLFRRALDHDPTYAQAYAGLCDSYLARYRRNRSKELFEEAERCCRRALTLDPTAPDTHVALGNLCRYEGRYEEALEALERAIALNPESAEAREARAETYAGQNRLDDAERAFHEAIDLQPGYWGPHQALGNFLMARGRFKDAIQPYRRVAELSPDNATAHSNLGGAHFMMGDFEKAAAAWRESLELNPTPGAYTNLGTMYFFLQRFEEAVRMYKRACATSPDDPEPWGFLADSYRQLDGHEEQAQASYETAIELAEATLHINPTDAETTGHLAHYCANLGQEERARELILKALSLAPENMHIRYCAALVYTSFGEIDRALEEVQRAVEFGYLTRLLPVDSGLRPLWDEDAFRSLGGD